MKKQTIAIVPAAGLGKRFHASQRKTFVNLNGIPLFIHTLKRLNREAFLTEIIPVLRQEDREDGRAMIQGNDLNKVKRLAAGGPERQDSIYNALRLIEETGTVSDGHSLVLIHDGVRPIFPEGMIARLTDGIEGVDGVVPGVPVQDTIKEIDPEGIASSTLIRENLRAVQTPQLFAFDILKKAYAKAYADGFYATDDAALVERIGGRVRIIEGSPDNIKVTTSEDLAMVECILKREEFHITR